MTQVPRQLPVQIFPQMPRLPGLFCTGRHGDPATVVPSFLIAAPVSVTGRTAPPGAWGAAVFRDIMMPLIPAQLLSRIPLLI